MNNARRLCSAMASSRIVRNAVKVSLFVGTVLNLINQGESLLAGHGLLIGSALLNYLVPYCVASYSGAKALLVSTPDASATRDARRR